MNKMEHFQKVRSFAGNNEMRLLIVQYAGDYREAFHRLSTGGDETYYAQRYSIDAVAEIGKQVKEVSTLCFLTEEYYDEVLSNGVRSIGAGFTGKIETNKIIFLIKKYNPTHLILRTPNVNVIRWAIKNRVKIIVILADSFLNKSLKDKLKNYWIANLLNNRQVDWVFNHGINSANCLKEIGVNPNKIIPWDWPHFNSPDYFLPKELPKNIDKWTMIYVGVLTEDKGLTDILEAVAKLKDKKLIVNLKIVGKGEASFFKKQTKNLHIEDYVEFLGLVPNKDIIDLMRASNVVLIPSRHEYPEGFPLTIYEALCSRTPIIASDHPMFRNKLKHRINALIFPAGNSSDLTKCIEELFSDSELYQNLSRASYNTWKSLQIPVKWVDMIKRWLDDSPESQQWLFDYRLSSGLYKSMLP